MKLPLLKRLMGAVIALGLSLAGSAFGQGLTSSTISGVVTDSGGKPVSGATVTAVYAPTHATSTTTTNSAGRYMLSGLPVGGPYTLTAAAPNVKSKEQTDIQLELS